MNRQIAIWDLGRHSGVEKVGPGCFSKQADVWTWVDKLFQPGKKTQAGKPVPPESASSATEFLTTLLAPPEVDPEPVPLPPLPAQTAEAVRPRQDREISHYYPQGGHLLITHCRRFGLRLHRLSDSTTVASWPSSEDFSHCEMAGSRLALAGASEVELWDIGGLDGSAPGWHPRLVARFPCSGSSRRKAAFDPEGKRLLVKHSDSLACYDEMGELCFTLPATGSFRYLPDGRILVAVLGLTKVFDSQGQPLTQWPIRFDAGLISSDGRWAIDRKQLFDLTQATRVNLTVGAWETAAFSPDSRWLALVDSGGLSSLVNLATLKSTTVTECEALPPRFHVPLPGDEPTTVLWDGPCRVLAGQADGRQVLWEVSYGLRRLVDFPLSGVQGSAGPYVLSWAPEGDLQVWRSDGTEQARFKVADANTP
jgi:hypothetical protein